MQSIRVDTGRPYTVEIGSGLLDQAGEKIAAVKKAKKVMIFSDDIVFPLYGPRLVASLMSSGFDCTIALYENGEERKRLSTVETLLEQMAAEHFSRSDLVVALGGGVCGDMAGFAAAIYARGIDYVQIPTTLLAAVDSSVGGKTAVDLKGGKNLCGAFHQPILVLCDTDTLNTLNKINIRDGLAEMLKYGVICDNDLFEKVKNYPNEDMDALIARCVEIKRDIVSGDEFDRGMRQLLNLGHTIGHAIEAASNFTVTHGHGVAAGMAIIARAADKQGFCKYRTAMRIGAALKKCDLPTTADYDAETLYELTLSDKKSDGDYINLIFPREIGHCEIVRTSKEELLDIIRSGL